MGVTNSHNGGLLAPATRLRLPSAGQKFANIARGIPNPIGAESHKSGTVTTLAHPQKGQSVQAKKLGDLGDGKYNIAIFGQYGFR